MKILHLAAGNRWTGAAAPAFAEVAALREAGVDAHYAFVGGYKLQAKIGRLGFTHPIIAKAQNPFSFVSSAGAIERLLDPPPAAAQSGQLSVVRASAFELVDENGAVLARLAGGPAGNGNLAVFNTSGARRTVVAGNGTFAAFDPDGDTLRFYAGYTLNQGLIGTPPVNGALLDSGGSVSVLSGCPGPVLC